MPVTRQQVVLAACCAIVGVLPYILGFALNPGPPPGLSFTQMAVFGTQHRTLILLGGWFQIIGTLLTVLYALAMVHFAGWSIRLAGALTLLGSTVLLVVGLMEVMFYVAVTSGDPMTL